jgi:hypothetical protein
MEQAPRVRRCDAVLRSPVRVHGCTVAEGGGCIARFGEASCVRHLGLSRRLTPPPWEAAMVERMGWGR